MTDKRQEFLKKWMDLINPNEDGTQAIYNAMAEYAQEQSKQQSIAFFKWQRNNYSSSPNEEELIERYDEFEKENKTLQSNKQ